MSIVRSFASDRERKLSTTHDNLLQSSRNPCKGFPQCGQKILPYGTSFRHPPHMISLLITRNTSDSNTTPEGDLLSGQSRDPARFAFHQYNTRSPVIGSSFSS